jgi:DUF2958 family protein
VKLLTQELRAALPKLYSQEDNKDPMVVAKFFQPWGAWTWFVIEGEAEDDDVRFFGMVHGFEKELGYFMLNELESLRGPGGLTIERDIHWTPVPLSKIEN